MSLSLLVGTTVHVSVLLSNCKQSVMSIPLLVGTTVVGLSQKPKQTGHVQIRLLKKQSDKDLFFVISNNHFIFHQ